MSRNRIAQAIALLAKAQADNEPIEGEARAQVREAIELAITFMQTRSDLGGTDQQFKKALANYKQRRDAALDALREALKVLG